MRAALSVRHLERSAVGAQSRDLGSELAVVLSPFDSLRSLRAGFAKDLLARASLLLSFLVVSLASPLHAQGQDSIAAIKANPQRYWNLEVSVAGLVGRADPSLAGSQGGSYRLIDYTDTLGISIESDELPAPGRLLRVHGIVVPSRDNATIPTVRERGRDALDRPPWLLWVIAVAATFAVALSIALFVAFKRRNEPGAAPLDAARPPVPIVVGGPVKMAPPPVFMPWAQPGARTSGAMPRPSLDGPMRPTPGAGTMPRLTPGASPVVRPSGPHVRRLTPGGSPIPRMDELLTQGGGHTPRMDELITRHTPPGMGTLIPGPGSRGTPRSTVPVRMSGGVPQAPLTQPFEPAAPRTEPFEYTGARLEVTEGPDTGRKVPIGSNTLLIGREGGRKNHLALSDSTVSRAQARIVRDDTFGFVLENESGTNRTLVNGEPAAEPMALEDGAQLRMGSTLVTFRTN